MDANAEIKDNTRKAYDTMATTYLKWTEPTAALRLAYLEKLLPYLPTKTEPEGNKTNEILEIGCGAGIPATSFLATQPNVHITANDISTAQIALAREHLAPHPNVTLLEGDMMKLDFPAGKFAAALGLFSIIHLPRDEQVVMLQRILGWLVPGGMLLATFAVEDTEHSVIRGWMGATEGEVFWSGFGVERTREVLAEIGFEVVLAEVAASGVKGDDDLPFLWVIARKP